jgi:signal transduction histidine kinase
MATLTVNNAAEILDRLRQAAPPATAAKIAQISALLESLSQENAYLNSLISEDSSLLDTSPPTSKPEPPPLPFSKNETIAGDTSALDLLVGINDALRAPLGAIRGRAELVQAGLLGQISNEQKQWLNAIHENTGRAFTLLDSVQQIIALHEGRMQIEWSSFVAADLLEEAHERIRDRAADHQHNITIQKPASSPMAHGDFYQSLIVLTHILDNAVRYTPPGGQIRLSVDNLGTHVLFNVADNGIGLTAEDMQHVGQPFWRGEHHKLVRQQPGTGLTLFLVRRILALQRGELIFSGEPDLGSTFSFTLMIPT